LPNGRRLSSTKAASCNYSSPVIVIIIIIIVIIIIIIIIIIITAAGRKLKIKATLVTVYFQD